MRGFRASALPRGRKPIPPKRRTLYARVSQIPAQSESSTTIPKQIAVLRGDLDRPEAHDAETRLRILTILGMLETNYDAGMPDKCGLRWSRWRSSGTITCSHRAQSPNWTSRHLFWATSQQPRKTSSRRLGPIPASAQLLINGKGERFVMERSVLNSNSTETN